jgi:two-component system chemotaxis sensor kinase CheA
LDNSFALPAETLARIRAVFFEECEEHMADLERGLLAIQEGCDDEDVVNTIFRAAHSIKGGAGIFDLNGVIRLSHALETALEEVRSKRLAITPPLVRTLLKAVDALADLVQAARDGAGAEIAPDADLIATLSALAAVPSADPAEDFEFTPLPRGAADIRPDMPEAEALSEEPFKIRFRPNADLYAKANEPLALLRELQRLGRLDVELDAAATPLLDALDPEGAYLEWRLVLTTDEDELAVRRVFEFVEDDCQLDIERAPAPAPGVEAPESQAAAPEALRSASGSGSDTLRVDLSRIDRMVSLVSELVIGQAILARQLSEETLSRRSAVPETLQDLDQLTRHIQDSVMTIRAQPVKPVFQRMQRLVREIEAATGKSVQLITEGEGVEVDRTVIERLADPLTHMIRNAIDHGIEAPEARLAARKPARGVVRISASHRAGRVVIEVSDDGGGIDRERVRRVAVERGVISADTVLSDEEVDNLIFAPGFSTAESVTDLSGRGVGMDVVLRSVLAFGGRVTMASRRGEGSTFTLSLPLTLAVVDGMLVSTRDHIVVAPLTTVIESFAVRSADLNRIGVDEAFVTLRGVQVPAIELGAALGFPTPGRSSDRFVALLVEGATGERAVLLVDEIHDQRQFVIKSLETNYQRVPGVSAATILGDGLVALILDVEALLAVRRPQGPATRQPKAA